MTIKRKRSTVVSEINIAPFTDVMLVLLIIFMITTPMMPTHTSSIKVNLPKTQMSSSSGDASNSNIEVLISKEGCVCIEGKEVDNPTIKDVINNLISSNPNRVIILKGDKQVQYEHVIHFIDKARKAGAVRFALAVDNNSVPQ
ncbi:MAG: biopolymer transporter ExbD [Endomicrobium sp.]|jgi:biopolymer transport protein ExbD|nr:biopolymer transporter ExbD [Endomicrobium sp.]